MVEIPLFSLPPEDELDSWFGADSESNIGIPIARRDSNITTDSLLANSGSSGSSAVSRAPDSSRDNESSVYETARASDTSSHYFSARGSSMSEISWSATAGLRYQVATGEDSEYQKLLKAKGIILHPLEELNWAGKMAGSGQHVEFSPTERPPLKEICLLGQSQSAEVHKVKCRRIFLARKRMTCGPHFTLQKAFLEVVHLQRLRHPHVIQLVGSYTKGRTFSILMYPVADYELSQFMAKVEDIILSGATKIQDYKAIVSLANFFACLTSAVDYVHVNATAHMDIKPRNILVKQHPRYEFGHRVYIADFGISRHFSPLDHSQTDAPTPFTRKYCAPEVSDQDLYGRPADIFSLGCVFLEMHTALCLRTRDDFMEYQSQDSNTEAFHVNLQRVIEWADLLLTTKPLLALEPRWRVSPSVPKERRNHKLISKIKKMLNSNASQRPQALDFFPGFFSLTEDCCEGELETFEVDEQEDRQNILQSVHNQDSDMKNLAGRPSKIAAMTEREMIALVAIANGNHGIVRQLLPQIDNLRFFGHRRGRTPFHYAAVEGDAYIMQLILDHTLYTEMAPINDGTSPLATRNGQRPQSQPLSQQILSSMDYRGLLKIACGRDHAQVVEVLLNWIDQGWQKFDDRYNPLLDVYTVPVMKLLLEKFPFSKPTTRVQHLNEAVVRASMHWRVLKNPQDLIDLLLREGASVEAQDLIGETNLHRVVRHSSIAVLQLLLDRGADIRAADSFGMTPLHVTGDSWTDDHLSKISLLLERGADIEAHTLRGETALHLAVRKNDGLLAELLLQKGADWRAKNVDGVTPNDLCNFQQDEPKAPCVLEVFNRLCRGESKNVLESGNSTGADEEVRENEKLP